MFESTHRQDKHQRGPCQAVSKLFPPLRSYPPPNYFLSFSFSLSLLSSLSPQTLSLPISASVLLPLSSFYTHMHTHTPPVQPPTVCRMCSGATRASGREASITNLPTTSLSADQRAAKQPETTASARAEHAQQHN